MITLLQRISEIKKVTPPSLEFNAGLGDSKSGGEGYSVFKDGIVKRTTPGLFQNS